jgi:hypothetical protein
LPLNPSGARAVCIAAALSAVSCSPGHDQNASDGGGPECAASQPSGCTVGFLGDAAAAPEFEFLALGADGAVSLLADGGTLPILVPPQGDRYVFPGVRATNIDGCQLELTAVLRDLSTRKIAFEHRFITLVSTGDGWGVSGVSGESIAVSAANFANVEVCPNLWSSTDIYGHQYGLEVMIQDQECRQATNKIDVTPECAEPANAAECLCLCKFGYVVGQPCDDGGSTSDAASEP